MDLKVRIAISDELTEEIISSTGLLDLASGEIHRIEYQDYDLAARGAPFESEDYEFTSGTLSHNDKDVEFTVTVNKVTGQYSVSANELLEIKVRAAQLFAGLAGKALLGQTEAAPAAKPAAGAGKARSGKARRSH